MSILKFYLKLVRPRQWIKNFFVFAPLVFSLELFDTTPLLTSIKAFFAFCLTASAVYVINDIADVESDRLHPEKKTRPLAAGNLSVQQAYALVLMLLALTGAMVFTMDLRYQIVLVSYFALNLAYSFKLKNVVLLDVFVIATGFMMRVLAGAYAIDVQVSSWIVLCSMFISLFLGFAKRRGEIILTQQQGVSTERKVLVLYRVDFIDQMLTIAAAGAVVSYALYTVAPRTLELLGTDKMIYTTVFVIYGIFRYLYLIHMTESTENPTKAVTSDLTIIATAILWILTCIIIIYSGGSLAFWAR
jgi:4-hydroxybenzoate polyprenyltransferase